MKYFNLLVEDPMVGVRGRLFSGCIVLQILPSFVPLASICVPP